jgi:hypothetical protein
VTQNGTAGQLHEVAPGAQQLMRPAIDADYVGFSVRDEAFKARRAGI